MHTPEHYLREATKQAPAILAKETQDTERVIERSDGLV